MEDDDLTSRETRPGEPLTPRSSKGTSASEAPSSEIGSGAHATQPHSPHLAPGTVLFGAYEIVDVLGSGGMGEVYRARHLSLGGLRAIKVMHPELAQRHEMIERFHAEARALLEVHHDAVVRCHDLLRDEGGRVFLVMEMIDGGSLGDRMRESPLLVREVRALGIRLAEGLEAAHACGVIHRDLSPDNILLPGGRVEAAKIIDFGIAKALASGRETISKGFKGKLMYASPEQLGFFEGRIDGRSDLYSLGLVLCAAALGDDLEMGTNFMQAVDARRELRGVPDGLPAALRSELAPLLALDPDDRPRSAAAVFGSWRGAQAPRPASVSRRSGARWWLAGLATAALIAFLIFAVRAPDAPTPETPLARDFATLREWLSQARGNAPELGASLRVDPDPVRDGAAYHVSVEASCACYPLLFALAGDGEEVSLLYPNPYDLQVRLEPQQPFVVPSSTEYELQAVAETGADELKLLVLRDFPAFPADDSRFWNASDALPARVGELADLRERLHDTDWAAAAAPLRIAP